MDYKKEIGKRLRKERDRLGWTLEEAEKRLDRKLSRTRISNYEQGLRLPKPAEVKVLAELYHAQASFLMCLDEEEGMNPEETELLRNFRALPENYRKDYSRRIESLALAYREAVPDEDARLRKWKAPHGPPKRKKIKG